MSDHTIENAIKLSRQLTEAAKEFDIASNRSSATKAMKELAEMDAQVCRDASAMLEKLGTEVNRLRLAIGHFEFGRMSRIDLIMIPRKWNGEPATPANNIGDGK